MVIRALELVFEQKEAKQRKQNKETDKKADYERE